MSEAVPHLSQPAGHHLAQLNVARALDSLESRRLSGFVRALDSVNAVAERSPGFVWRLQGDAGNALDVSIGDGPRFIVNMSVWESAEALEQFVWNTVHKNVYRRKAQWFESPSEPNFVMWWVPKGHQPTVAEAMAKLDSLRRDGPSADAFGWESLPQIKLWMQQQCA
jgi:Domain of unknown function (DUF3291)